MADQIPEIYADDMVGFTISKDGNVAKLILASARPNGTGGIESVPVAVLTMPTLALQTMISDLMQASQAHKQGAPDGPKN